MSTLSSARRLLSHIENPEKLISRRTRSEPTLLFDLEEDDMAGQAPPQGPIRPPARWRNYFRHLPMVSGMQFFENDDPHCRYVDVLENTPMMKLKVKFDLIIDTFYNSLSQADQDSLNSAAEVKGTSRLHRIGDCCTKMELFLVRKRCESVVHTPTSSDKPLVATLRTYTLLREPITKVVILTDHKLKNHNTNMVNKMDQMQKVLMERPQGVLLSNIVPNPRENLKAITTQSGATLAGPLVPPLLLSSSKEVNREPETIMDQIHFNISFAEALAHMPKFAKMVKDILTNKEKLLELANTPLNENCSAMLLKKLPEKLRYTERFLIPCDFYGLKSCMALADLGASINLMKLYVWKTLSLPDLYSTRMTLELATRTVAYPAGIAEDVFVQMGKFTFLADFVVVDYEVDLRVPLILRRPFLRTAHALVDLHSKKLTLQVGDEELVFNVESTLKYPQKHGDESIHKIDILDITCEDHFQEIPSGIDNGIYYSKGDILFLEELLNEDPSPNLPPIPLHVCLIDETKKIKSSIDDPPDLDLKDLPPHLKYVYLEGTSKLPVIISKDLKSEEKE
ncbi:reverse transcriptase domain-containing protein [Tanacetum coccineum]